MSAGVPRGAFLAQTLHYTGCTLHVWFHRRKVYIRENGDYPFDPVHKRRHPHPDEGTEPADASYETLGLYYGLGMPETGWGSEGEF